MSQWDRYLDRQKADVNIIIGTYASTSLRSVLNNTIEAPMLTVLSCSLQHSFLLLLTWLLYICWYCRLNTSESAMATVAEVYQKLCSIWYNELNIIVWMGNSYKSEIYKAHTYIVKTSITLIKSRLGCWEPVNAHTAHYNIQYDSRMSVNQY